MRSDFLLNSSNIRVRDVTFRVGCFQMLSDGCETFRKESSSGYQRFWHATFGLNPSYKRVRIRNANFGNTE